MKITITRPALLKGRLYQPGETYETANAAEAAQIVARHLGLAVEAGKEPEKEPRKEAAKKPA